MQYRITPFDMTRRRRRIVIVALVVVGLLLAAFYAGKGKKTFDNFLLDETLQELDQLRDEHEDQVKELTSRIVDLESGAKIHEAAYAELKDAYRQLEQQCGEQYKELSFYREIIGAASLKRGFNLHRFKLTAADKPGYYIYQLVVTQVGLNDIFVRGNVSGVFSGQLDGQPIRYNLTDLVIKDKSQTDFGFRYFQEIQGVIHLPKGFEPESLAVTIKPSNTSRIEAITKEMSWKTMLESGEVNHAGQE